MIEARQASRGGSVGQPRNDRPTDVDAPDGDSRWEDGADRLRHGPRSVNELTNEAYDSGFATGQMRERANIIAYLRIKDANKLAEQIEHGAHMDDNVLKLIRLREERKKLVEQMNELDAEIKETEIEELGEGR